MSEAGAEHGRAAHAAALRMLSVRSLSERELIERLAARGWSDEAPCVVTRLRELRLLDDAALAESIARAELARRPIGAPAIEAKILRRKIDPELARSAAREAVSGRSEAADARQAAERHARALPPKLSPEARKRRLLGRLARLGFSGEASRAAVERIVGSSTDE